MELSLRSLALLLLSQADTETKPVVQARCSRWPGR
jgi:hypothetical protein